MLFVTLPMLAQDSMHKISTIHAGSPKARLMQVQEPRIPYNHSDFVPGRDAPTNAVLSHNAWATRRLTREEVLPRHRSDFRGILQVPLRSGNSRNYISQLPDEIAVFIVSYETGDSALPRGLILPTRHDLSMGPTIQGDHASPKF